MKTKKILSVLLALCLLTANALAAAEYTEAELKLMREVYELSDESIKFLSDHNIDASIFPNIPKETLTVVVDHEYGRIWRTDYDDAIRSVSAQAQAYGFTDEQVAALVKGEMPYDHSIMVAGPKEEDREYLSSPTFDVTLNGKAYDSKKCDYPMLYYKEITYLPLTADNMAYMGLSFELLPEENKAYVRSAPISSDKHSAHTTPLWIDLVYKPLYIPDTEAEVLGGKANEEYPDYPFIVYKNVYYMPMTWEYMHDVLGWQYSFDHEKGLVVDSREN